MITCKIFKFHYFSHKLSKSGDYFYTARLPPGEKDRTLGSWALSATNMAATVHDGDVFLKT